MTELKKIRRLTTMLKSSWSWCQWSLDGSCEHERLQPAKKATEPEPKHPAYRDFTAERLEQEAAPTTFSRSCLISLERWATSFALGLSYETKSVSALKAYGYHVIDCRDTDLDLYRKIDLIGTPPGSNESQLIQVKAPTNKGLLVEYTAVNGKQAGQVSCDPSHEVAF